MGVFIEAVKQSFRHSNVRFGCGKPVYLVIEIIYKACDNLAAISCGVGVVAGKFLPLHCAVVEQIGYAVGIADHREVIVLADFLFQS